MILRSLTKHVRDQNWFAVFLDFIIVVVGVFIGIQVANWNSALEDQSLRAEYLTQLTEDLEADIAEAKDTEQQAWTRAAAIDDIFEAAGLEKPLRELYSGGAVLKAPPIPDFVADYPYAHNHIITDLPIFEETRETFDALVSNGHFGLLNDPQLVRQIQTYQRQVESVQGFDEAIIQTFRRITELRSRHGISVTGRTTLDDFAKALQSDKQLTAELETYFFNSGVQAARANALGVSAEELVKAIKEAEK
jgi:prefoldin subunit 5